MSGGTDRARSVLGYYGVLPSRSADLLADLLELAITEHGPEAAATTVVTAWLRALERTGTSGPILVGRDPMELE